MAAFDAGSIEASLAVRTDQFNRDMDAAEARVKRFEEGKHEIKISAVFDTNSLSRARQQFAALDQQISKDAMSRLRSNPQGSVLGALNALFSPHPVTGAPSASQAAQQGLLGKIVQAPGPGSAGPSGGQNVIQDVTGSGGAQSNANQRVSPVGLPQNTTTTDKVNVVGGAKDNSITTTDRVNTVGLPTNNAITTEDRVNVTGLPTSGGTITTTDKIEPDVDMDALRAKVAEAATGAADDADAAMTAEAKKKGPGWFSGFLTGIGNLFGSGGAGDQAASDAGTKAADAAASAAKKEAAKQSGSILASLFGGGGDSGGGQASALDKGLIGGIGPGILGTSFKSASLIGLGGAALGGIPALAAGTAPLAVGAAGLGVAALGAKTLIGTANQKGQAPTEGPLFAQAQAAGQALQQMVQTAAAGLVTPLKNLFGQIPSLAKQITPALSQVFSGSVALIQPAVTGLVNLIKEIGPGLGDAFKATGPLLQPLITGIGQLVGGLLPGLVSLLKAAGPAVQVVSGFFASLGTSLGTMFSQFSTVIGPSSTILKALLDVVTGLLPVIGGLAQAMAGALGPAFTAFAGAIKALEPFLVTVGQILAQFAGAVLTDLSGGLQLVASILKAVSPAFNQLATALGQVFNTLESKGGFAQLGNILEGLATPIGNLIKSLVSGLAPAIPPLLNLFSSLVNVVSSVGVQVLTALIPPITNLAQIALGALMKVLPQVIPIVTQFVSVFTADAGTLISQVGAALLNLATVVLTKLLQAAQPLIPAVLALLSAFTPLLNILTPVVATTITAIADALAAVVNAIPSGVLTAAIAGVAGLVAGMKLWGLATTAVATGMKAITGLSLVSWLSGAVTGIKDFAVATEGATLAEKGLLASELAVEAVSPLGWAVAGAAAVAGIVYALSTLNDGIGATVSALAKQDQAANYNISGYQKLAAQTAQLGQAQQQMADSVTASAAKNAGAVREVLSNNASAYSQVSSQVQTLAQNLVSRLSALSDTFGVSKTQIEQWATAAGISAEKFGSSSENVQKLTDQIATYVNKNAEAVTSTSSLATNVSIFGNDVFTTTTQLDAFNAIWNTLVGNLLTKQVAVTQAQQSFDGLKQSITDNGTASVQTQQSFQAYIQQVGSSVSTLLQQGTSIGQVNDYLQKQIDNLTSLGPLNKSQQADVNGLIAVQDQLANSTRGLSDQQLTFIQQVEGHIIPDLQAMGADTPQVTTDVDNLANSIAQTGTKSASTAADRAQLIKDLEQAGASSQQATSMVDNLTSALSKVPKSVGTTVTVSASAKGALTAAAQISGTSVSNIEALLQFGAAGMLVSGGTPGKDSVLAMLMPGEVVVPTSMVQAGAVDHLRGAIPGFASGGMVDLAGPSNWMRADESNWAADATEAWMQKNISVFNTAASQAAAVAAAALTPTGSGATIQALMKSMAASVGWSGAEWTALNALEAREAGFSLTATNPSSGAYGLAQFISGPSEYATYGGNSSTAQGQITGMFNYIKQRYGDPVAAEAHEVAYGWYDRGGYLKPGYTLAYNGTGRPEQVMANSGGGASFDDVVSRLDRLIRATEQVPAGVGAHVGGAINGASHDASFRSRYPRSSP